MDLRSLLSLVQIAGILAFSVLTFHLLRSGRFLALRWFTFHAVLMVADLIWHPLKITEAMFIEPWLMLARFCMTIEAAALVSDSIAFSQRRALLLSLLFVGGVIGLRSGGYFDATTLRGLYYTGDLCCFMAIAGFGLSLNVYQLLNRDISWDWLWIPHFRLVSAYMIGRAVLMFTHIPGDGPAHHAVVRIATMVFTCAWIVVWGWYDGRELRAPRFKRLNPVL